MCPTPKLFSKLRTRAAYFLPVLFCLVAASPAQEPQTHTLRDGRINVSRIVKVFISPTTPAYSITYEYRYPDHTSVHIANFGVAPASGKFNYLTTDQSLTIYGEGGHLLTSVPIRETIISAAKPPLNEIANETEFPSAHRAFPWRDRATFLARANSVLGRYFRYRPSERDGKTFIITTFAPLEVPSARRGIIGQIAVLLSFPYNPEGDSYYFRVQSLIREGRTHSDEFHLTSDAGLTRAGAEFVDQLVTELTQGVSE